MTADASWTRLILDVPDFPKPGIIFKDISPLLADGAAFRAVTKALAAPIRDAAEPITHIVAIEARGFIFGAALSEHTGIGFVPVRKPGKLPRKTTSITYDLEYGTDTIEFHADAVAPGDRVLLVDDVLATGGTAAAACALIAKTGATLAGVAFVMELDFLDGRKRLPAGVPIHTLHHVG
jgi:adenine phosphoribosyltransferase